MIGPESRQVINEYIRRKNGVLRTMVAAGGIVGLVTAYIVWDIKNDAHKKDLARERAVEDLKKTAQISDDLGRQRYDSLAAQIQELRRLLGIHAGVLPAPVRLDTNKFKEQLYQQQKLEESKLLLK